MIENQDVIQPEESEKKVLYWNKTRHNTLGIMLIIIGSLFLVERAGLIEFTWPLILMVIGFICIVEAWLSRRVEGIFPAVLITLLGLILHADSMVWITGGVSRNWPFIILAFSFALLLSSAFSEPKKNYWVPGVILLAAGGLFLLVEYGNIRLGIMSDFLEWWPFSLLILGIWFLLRKAKTPA